ncbi:MAG: hypothetical protein OXT74_19375 [Candidatus Poribacteria bacterium]|nr:hypothetical protein [Candidatus Poribacteria bacterium]
MNYKQKSGYMLLGAGLLAVGIIMGRFIETRLKAESGGVFEKITCRELDLVDKDGNRMIGFRSTDESAGAIFYSREGRMVMFLGSADELGSSLSMFDQFGQLTLGLGSSSSWDNLIGNGLTVYDMYGRAAVELSSTLRGNQVRVYNSGGEVAAEMVSDTDNGVSLEDRWLERKIKRSE